MDFSTTTRLTLIASTLVTLAATNPLLPRYTDQPGLQWAQNVSFGGCTADQQATILSAMASAVTLSTSALSALTQSPYSNPAAYFFPSSYSSNAQAVFQTAIYALAPDPTQKYTNLNPIWLYCTDISSLCATDVANPAGGRDPLLGYVPEAYNPTPGEATASTPALFVVCPAMLALPPSPAPCSHSPGPASLGWGFLRTFLTLRSVQPGFPKLGAGAIADRNPGVSASHALVGGSGAGPYDANADNYAELAYWSYLLQVGEGGKVGCPQDCGNLGQGVSC